MFDRLPPDATELKDWPWEKLEPYYDDLLARSLDEAGVDNWLRDWTRLAELVWEAHARLSLANTQDTADEAAEAAYHRFLGDVRPPATAANQKLIEKLLASGLEPDGFAIPLRNMRTDAALFREANLPLQVEESRLGSAFNKIAGAQTVTWDGEERTLAQLEPYFETPDRATRAAIWRATSERILADREAFNELWQTLLANRMQQATNAGFDDYRAFRWQQLKRFEYTPDDCLAFHRAIESVVAPAAGRIYAGYARELAVAGLRPWDVRGDYRLLNLPPVAPAGGSEELDQRAVAIFDRVDPAVGGYFRTMRQEGLLDLVNRKGKAPGGYCTSFPAVGRPFIFMNSVGTASDVRTILHEAGHAFHMFENSRLPYLHQRRTTAEFNEVASMAMELLAYPYLAESDGGYFSPADSARWKIDHLRKIILFWPYMAVVDAFQHWVYTQPEAAADPARCDETWGSLWDRFLPWIDWSGHDAVKVTGWHRKLHIFLYPFYYVEYGLAQIGAVQVWRNARQNQASAVRSYLDALALGGTRPVPDLYEAAGVRFAWDEAMMSEVVGLLEEAIEAAERAAAGSQ